MLPVNVERCYESMVLYGNGEEMKKGMERRPTMFVLGSLEAQGIELCIVMRI